MTDTDTRDDISTTSYVAPDGTQYRVRIVQDDDANSPRENDNPTVIHTFHSHWLSPDREPDRDRKSGGVVPVIPREYVDTHRGVDMRRARRWVNLFGRAAGVLAIAGVERIQGGWAEGGLRITDNDDRAVGYVAITRESWDTCMGADVPLDGSPWPGSTRRAPSAAEVMASDVAEYSRWVAGEIVGVIVERRVKWVQADSIDNEGAYDDDDTMQTWEQIEYGALWGIDNGDDEHQRQYGNYALAAGLEMLPEGCTPLVMP